MKIYYDPKLKKLARELRNNSTLAEIMLWNEIKGRRLRGYQFMRQKPIEKYIVDFFCSITFLRFDDLEVRYNLDNVIKTLENRIDQFESAVK